MASFASSANTGGARKPPGQIDVTLKVSTIYCYHHRFLVQACLRAPHVVADEAKLAIVFTYFFLLLSFSFFFFLLFLRLLLFTHFKETPMTENLFPPIFWHNQKEYLKKKLVIFIFYEKKNYFQRTFSSFYYLADC